MVGLIFKSCHPPSACTKLRRKLAGWQVWVEKFPIQDLGALDYFVFKCPKFLKGLVIIHLTEFGKKNKNRTLFVKD
jgi:hypothetical protein